MRRRVGNEGLFQGPHLLYLQAELTSLENAFHKEAKSNAESGHFERSLYARDWQSLRDSITAQNGDPTEWELGLQIRDTLKEYKCQLLALPHWDPFPPSYEKWVSWHLSFYHRSSSYGRIWNCLCAFCISAPPPYFNFHVPTWTEDSFGSSNYATLTTDGPSPIILFPAPSTAPPTTELDYDHQPDYEESLQPPITTCPKALPSRDAAALASIWSSDPFDLASLDDYAAQLHTTEPATETPEHGISAGNGEHVFHCVCGVAFTRLDSLKRHIKSKTAAGKTLPCPLCEQYDGTKGFSRHDHLMQHLEGYHKIDRKRLSFFDHRQGK
ncbi:hypothetical protein B0T25DRAFT_630352 [Lasiosphaeria hispida]|uniref:C2H2-type domain-containing protein n=1 Tax=Lasiosphaeria hispida TaxID=260671 RepID=A0AAJ0HLT2_9PEZI|nr:hypothetical protein B0T25DRAFT_630352 [Lasiosphaeria hispida]